MVRIQNRDSSKASTRDVMLIAFGILMGFAVTVMFGSSSVSSTSNEGLPTQGQHMMQDMSSFTSHASQSLQHESNPQENDGFHPLHIYYGKMNEILDQIPAEKFWRPANDGSRVEANNRMWFSQHGQDVAVAKALGYRRNGFYVDLASNDAVWASNTFTLEQHFGWNGICIEGNPIYWYRLGHRRCHTVGAMVGGTDGDDITVRLAKNTVMGPYSGIVGKDFDNKRGSKDDNEHRYTVSLRTILRKFNAPTVIDYLSLDVEGAEMFIMKDFPFDEYKFLCMTVERPSEELQAILTRHGYQKAMDIKRGDTLWVHGSIYEKARTGLAVNPEEIDSHKVASIPK